MERNNIHEYAKAKLLNSGIDFFFRSQKGHTGNVQGIQKESKQGYL